MSENENENGNVGGSNGGPGDAGSVGSAGSGWGWEPVPHGGEYDSDATAFVKLPQDMLDALGTGEPLAAPGHGYVPPPMIVPLGSASTDPAATGTWTISVPWPEAGSAAAAPAPGPAPVGGPIPASIPLPASVAAAFADPAAAAAAAPAGTDRDPGDSTAEWRFPEAAQEPEGSATGQWAMREFPEQPNDYRQSGLTADWSQAPATLPGGAAAPWANHPHYEGAQEYAAQQPDPDLASGVLPGTDEAAAASAAAAAADAAAGRLLGGPGAEALRRGPRVLGGPGVGTPLAEDEPVHPAPHDIDAAHGAAAAPVAGERPHPVAEPAGAAEAAEAVAPPVARVASAVRLDLFGSVRAEAEPAEPLEPAAPLDRDLGPDRDLGLDRDLGPDRDLSLDGDVDADQAPAAEPAGVPGPVPPAKSLPAAEPAEPGSTDGHGFAVSGDPAPEPAGTDGHGFAGTGPAPEDTAAEPTPGADTADRAVVVPDTGTAGGFPAQEPTYEEEAAAEAVAHHEHPLASYVLRVNGADRPVTGAWIGESLLYVLRERLGLAGAKDGCSQGECGACAVQVDGRLVASCLVPAATAAGSEVRTVEGLATDGELSDVQQALCRSGAVQCGFCVPGMAMTIHDLLEGNHAPSELETRQALCGNLCRCSGYAGVIDAVREVVAGRDAAASASEPAGSPAPPEPSTPSTPSASSSLSTHSASSEPWIPHQAPPGEGGIHGMHHGGTA